jgi:SAM-dependent methyltransferase
VTGSPRPAGAGTAQPVANAYSRGWFELCLDRIPDEQTEAEVAFVARQLPLPAYRSVLDLCCGPGRHALRLAARGYAVTGVDRDEVAIAAARERAGDLPATFRTLDLRDFDSQPGRFDAVLSLWQSFGYFDEATNSRVQRQAGDRLRPGGRLLLDLYHRGFFERRQGSQEQSIGDVTVRTTRRMAGARLSVDLDYGPGRPPDRFEWQLYTPQEVRALGEAHGLMPVVACAGFDEAQPPSPDLPRMQLILEKRERL